MNRDNTLAFLKLEMNANARRVYGLAHNSMCGKLGAGAGLDTGEAKFSQHMQEEYLSLDPTDVRRRVSLNGGRFPNNAS